MQMIHADGEEDFYDEDFSIDEGDELDKALPEDGDE